MNIFEYVKIQNGLTLYYSFTQGGPKERRGWPFSQGSILSSLVGNLLSVKK